MLPARFHVEGHAIVSADGMIADAAAAMPSVLMNPADFALFQAALDRADVVVLGRKGHLRHPNPGRRRLVLTRSVGRHRADPADPLAMLCNPDSEDLTDVLGAMGLGQGRLAVPGGRAVFDLFAGRFDAFELSEAHGATIPDGVPCFSAGHPRTVLAASGMRPRPMRTIDAAAGVTLTTWTRATGAA